MNRDTYTEITDAIYRHLHDIQHLQKVSANHPELFSRTIARHRRDIAELQSRLNKLKQNDT